MTNALYPLRGAYTLQLFRTMAAFQRVRPSLEWGTLAWRRLDREQAALEAAIAALSWSFPAPP